MKEVFKKIRRYEIRIRKAIDAQMQGDFKSIFRGSGIEYEGVRSYQWGDDIRTIDWKVSAKGHGTFVKTFIEEKEQTVFFLLDVSASQEIGKKNQQKIDVAKEVTSILTLSAIKEKSKVGLLCYSDQIEDYIKPGKSSKHANMLMSRLFDLKPKSKRTDLNEGIKSTINILKKKAIIFVVSDFIDEEYFHVLKGLGKKHDVVILHVSDQLETAIPELGIVPLLEKESNKTVWFNTSTSHFQDVISSTHGKGKEELKTFCKRNDINYIHINTGEDYIPTLIRLFKYRNRSNVRRTR